MALIYNVHWNMIDPWTSHACTTDECTSDGVFGLMVVDLPEPVLYFCYPHFLQAVALMHHKRFHKWL